MTLDRPMTKLFANLGALAVWLVPLAIALPPTPLAAACYVLFGLWLLATVNTLAAP